MAWTTTPGNYVKFLRGTPEAWAAQTNPNPDTLYFIAEENATKGRLYLGSKLISDGFVQNISTMGDLEDVLLENNISTGSLLVYDSASHKWKNRTLAQVFSLIVTPMTGASATQDGASGLVPQPLAGDQTKYLRGDGTWQNPTATLQNIVNVLVGSDVGKSIRTVANEEASSAVADILDGAPAAFDTLKEIADWIQGNTDAADIINLGNRVTTLETVVVNGTDGTPSLVSQVSTLNTNVTNLTTTVTNIEETIRWQDMVEE